jgi:hypothetical protein
MYIRNYLLPISIFIVIFIVLILLVVNAYEDKNDNINQKKEKFEDLPASEIVVLNRKLPTETQAPDLTSKLCNETGVCFGHLNFNYNRQNYA